MCAAKKVASEAGDGESHDSVGNGCKIGVQELCTPGGALCLIFCCELLLCFLCGVFVFHAVVAACSCSGGAAWGYLGGALGCLAVGVCLLAVGYFVYTCKLREAKDQAAAQLVPECGGAAAAGGALPSMSTLRLEQQRLVSQTVYERQQGAN